MCQTGCVKRRRPLIMGATPAHVEGCACQYTLPTGPSTALAHGRTAENASAPVEVFGVRRWRAPDVLNGGWPGGHGCGRSRLAIRTGRARPVHASTATPERGKLETIGGSAEGSGA